MIKFLFKSILRRIKIVLHRTGQFLVAPFWNYLAREDIYADLTLGIISTKICNANCIFCCYQFLPQDERIMMSDQVFDRIVEDIPSMPIRGVHFTSNSGEPLVDPNILNKMKRLRSAGVKRIVLTTNGIFIDKFGAGELLKDGPDIINISTAAFDPEMYARLYRSLEFERMRRNVLGLLEINSKSSYKRVINIEIYADISKDQVLAMAETKELIRLADNVLVCEEYADWIGLIKPSMLSGVMKLEKPEPLSNRPCRIVTKHPAIHPNGDMTACICRNITNDPDMRLGNILSTDLKSAMDKLKKLCENWRNGKIPAVCFHCTMYNDPAYYWPAYLRRTLFKEHS